MFAKNISKIDDIAAIFGINLMKKSTAQSTINQIRQIYIPSNLKDSICSSKRVNEQTRRNFFTSSFLSFSYFSVWSLSNFQTFTDKKLKNYRTVFCIAYNIIIYIPKLPLLRNIYVLIYKRQTENGGRVSDIVDRSPLFQFRFNRDFFRSDTLCDRFFFTYSTYVMKVT